MRKGPGAQTSTLQTCFVAIETCHSSPLHSGACRGGWLRRGRFCLGLRLCSGHHTGPGGLRGWDSASQTGGSSGLSWQLPSPVCPLLFPHSCLLSSLGKCNLSQATFNYWDAVVLSPQGNKGSVLLSMLGALRVPKEGGRGSRA